MWYFLVLASGIVMLPVAALAWVPTANEPTPVTVSFGKSDYQLNEGQTVDVTITLSADPGRTVEIPITGSSDLANEYSLSASSVTFEAGDSGDALTETITFTAADDTRDEVSETVILQFGALPDGVTVEGNHQTRVGIEDNDGTPTVSIDSPSVAEGDSGTTTLTFTATLSAASERSPYVSYEITEGTADRGADYYVLPLEGKLTFDSTETQKTVAITVNGDTVIEPDETVLVTLKGPMGNVIFSPPELISVTATGTIIDDDASTPTPTPTATPPPRLQHPRQRPRPLRRPHPSQHIRR